ncbi:MAG TPA: hypothetical protein VMZ91_12095 [Candidatus Paceibacterota bacterium]|nr:hypothetical protein [Candidatus Paceibacterota bacterium]
METKTFKLPEHPTLGKQQIVVEKPAPESVWYLVIEPDKAVPLVNLEKPESAKQVLEAAGKQNGEDFVRQFVQGGFSKL